MTNIYNEETELINVLDNNLEKWEKFKIARQEETLKECMKYSEHRKALKIILGELTIKLKPIGIALDHDYYKENFGADNRRVYSVIVQRLNKLNLNEKKKEIRFNYCDSLANAQENKKPNLYDILNCMSSDYYCETDFVEFCAEFGYNDEKLKNYKKVMEVFERCKEQSEKLQSMFTQEEIEAFPR